MLVHMNELRSLCDDGLLASLKSAVERERVSAVYVLEHLREVERRMLHAKYGYASLYEYCLKELKYSEGAAYRRISAMRLLREAPELKEKIADGSVSITAASVTHSYLKKNRDLTQEERDAVIKLAENKSRRELERELNRRDGQAGITYIRLAITAELREKLEQLKNRLCLPEGVRLETLLERLVEDELKRFANKELKTKAQPQVSAGASAERMEPKARQASNNEKRAFDSKSKERYIPAQVKVLVWKRDGGRCTYTHPESKRRCESKYALQFDHILPVSMGGKSVVENLRLLCAEHNRFEAIEVFGPELMGKYLPGLQEPKQGPPQ